jgi:hypothetical protein
MARLQHFRPQTPTRVAAAFLSCVLHVGLLALIVLSGGRQDGVREDPAPSAQVLFLATRTPERREGSDSAPWTQVTPELGPREQLDLPRIEPPSIPFPEIDIPRTASHEMPSLEVELEDTVVTIPVRAVEMPSTFVMPEVQASKVLKRVERLAAELAETPRAQVTWKQDGRRYHAELALEPARSSLEPERAIAEIRAEDQGRQLVTRISLKRLPFSHFAQVIDRWNRMVQLHDDEIVGRVHINSRFNVLQDSQAAPRLLGKVTTAAGGVDMDRRGRERDSEIFREGIRTRAGRIRFSKQEASFEEAKQSANARVHELAGDTRIRFLGDRGYAWRDDASGAWQHGSWPAGQSVYFMAVSGATVRLRGVVSGQVLVYSPERIVVEDDLTYARDPRSDPNSEDFLGIVCDRDIEVAPPDVTGPGDLQIQAALFAKHRVIVTKSGHRPSATLKILGSLAAGSLTASEPRYATKVEYDWRFERLRPPEFPSTNRFEAEDWDGEWTEVPERAAYTGS